MELRERRVPEGLPAMPSHAVERWINGIACARGPRKMKMSAPAVDNCHESQALDRALASGRLYPFARSFASAAERSWCCRWPEQAHRCRHRVMKAALQEPKLKHDLHAVVKFSQDCHTDFG